MNTVTLNIEKEYGLNVYKDIFFRYSEADKKKYIEFDYVNIFIEALNRLEKGLGDTLLEIFLTAKFPLNWQYIRQEILNLGGFIGPVLCKNPGSAKFMDLLYRYDQPQGPLDEFLMNCHSGRAVDYRKTATIKHVGLLLSHMHNGHGGKKVLNLGSGCGYDTIEMSDRDEIIAKQVSFINVDIDPQAIVKGKLLLQKGRYQHLAGISFLESNMLRIRMKNASVALIIGVLCGFSQNECVRNLRIVKSFIAPCGIVYGACVTDRMLFNDLFASFVLEELLGWHLCYRKPEKVQEMFERAGYLWRPDLTFTEKPTQFYMIGAGEVPQKS
ncbi:MAG: methyltransferase domain-containing protein [bacterium]